MSEKGGNPASIISPRIAIGLALISMLSLVAYFALSAYAPDFRDESDGGAHALSKSATGFAGLRILLDAAGASSAIDRGLTPHAGTSLVVLTPPEGTQSSDILAVTTVSGSDPARTLIILPKWETFSDSTGYGRVLKAGTADESKVAELLQVFSKKTKIARRHDTSAPHLTAADDFHAPVVGRLAAVDSLQTISGESWVPLVVDSRGGAVLVKLNDEPVYVLSDPDLMNTQGLDDLPTASFAFGVIRRLRNNDGPVLFDVTLNGLGRQPDLLRELFSPPFLGATLCAILAAALIGFNAAVRFGSPPAPLPAYARGKRALANNAADMIRMLRREPRMAARYALTNRNLVLRALGVRRQLDMRDGDALFKSLERGDSVTYAQLLAEAGRVESRSDLVALARRLYEWRRGMTHAR